MSASAACPNCGRPSLLTADNRWRPFCCQRCKLGDLGDWFSGKHSIPGEPVDPDTLPQTDRREVQ